MKQIVYLLFYSVDYEGEEFKGVFHSFDKAFSEMEFLVGMHAYGSKFQMSKDLHSAVYDDRKFYIISREVL